MKKVTLLPILFISLFLLLINSCDDFNLIDLISSDITLVPEEAMLDMGESITFHVAAGVAPYTFKQEGDGNIDKTTGEFTASGSPGDITVLVTDSKDRTAEAAVTVVDMLKLSPQMVTTGIGGVINFSISGGLGPYTVTLDNTTIGIENHPGDSTPDFDFTAAAEGTETITVNDNGGQSVSTQVTIINITTPDLTVTPATAEVLAGKKYSFLVSGGTPDYTYALTLPKSGSIDQTVPTSATTVVYTAPPSPFTGQDTITVTDSNSTVVTATIYVVDELLTISPASQVLPAGWEGSPFTVTHGTPPYTYSIAPEDADSAWIDSSTGYFKALTFDHNVQVLVEDSNGNIDTCKVIIQK